MALRGRRRRGRASRGGAPLPVKRTWIEASEGLAGVSTSVTKLLQRGPVEGVPGGAGEPRDEVDGLFPRHTRGDELSDRLLCVGDSLGALATTTTRPENERDLAARRLGEPFRELRDRPVLDLLEALRQLAADGRRSVRHHARKHRERRGEPPRRLERDDRPGVARELLGQRL